MGTAVVLNDRQPRRLGTGVSDDESMPFIVGGTPPHDWGGLLGSQPLLASILVFSFVLGDDEDYGLSGAAATTAAVG